MTSFDALKQKWFINTADEEFTPAAPTTMDENEVRPEQATTNPRYPR